MMACTAIFEAAASYVAREEGDDGDGETVDNGNVSINYDALLCRYARNCEGGWPSVHLLPLVLCRDGGVDGDGGDTKETEAEAETEDETEIPTGRKRHQNRGVLHSVVVPYVLLPPAILTALYLSFRLLATTAEHYFGPALESMADELGLPPRFAGATLLAVGNGAPDVSATVQAVLLWKGNVDGGDEYPSDPRYAGWNMRCAHMICTHLYN